MPPGSVWGPEQPVVQITHAPSHFTTDLLAVPGIAVAAHFLSSPFQPAPFERISSSHAVQEDLRRRFPPRALTPEECANLGVAPGSFLGPPQLLHTPAPYPARGAIPLRGEPGRRLTEEESALLGVAPGSIWGSHPTRTVVTASQVPFLASIELEMEMIGKDYFECSHAGHGCLPIRVQVALFFYVRPSFLNDSDSLTCSPPE